MNHYNWNSIIFWFKLIICMIKVIIYKKLVNYILLIIKLTITNLPIYNHLHWSYFFYILLKRGLLYKVLTHKQGK